MTEDFTTPMRDRIIATYDQHMLRKSVLSIRGGGGVLQAVLGGGQYKRALEIGTYRGVGAAEISQYVEHVDTIDLRFGKIEINRRDGRDAIDMTHDREAFWRSLGIDNISLHLISSEDEKAQIIAGLDFDFALIDGAHDDPAIVRNDFELVKHCGAVLFHDVDWRSKPEQNIVVDFVASLPQHEVTYIDIFALWRPANA